MDIYEIENKTQKTAPYFFSRDTLRFFGQTMRSFKVYKEDDSDRWVVYAPIKKDRKIIGETIRFFNPVTNDLELR